VCPRGTGFEGLNAMAFPKLGLLCGVVNLVNNGER
jgi:hypothetical protein